MKRSLALFLSLLMCMSMFAGCGGEKSAQETQQEPYEPEFTEYEPLNTPAPKPLDVYLEKEGSGYRLSWEAAKDADSYDVYRSATRYGEFVKINGEPLNTTEFSDPDASEDCCYEIAAIKDGDETARSDKISETIALFGKNVLIFSPEDDIYQVQETTGTVFRKQQTNQFGQARYALLFKPGEYYDKLDFQVGFYTQVAGLGLLPTDTQYGRIYCSARWLGDASNHNATCNFWRSVENITIPYTTMWAVSQATSMRRMKIEGALALHDDNGWASGGFLADSVITGIVDSGSQQQWLSRNDDWGQWNGQNWNMVFVGLEEGDAPSGTWPETKYTTVDKTPVIAEKPYLVYDENGYGVFVPSLQKDSSGITWADGSEDGTLIPISDFYVARPEYDTSDTINEALDSGKSLILTPGIYKLNKTIRINNPDTVVLGLGLATVYPMQGQTAVEIADVDGVRFAGVLIDAGPKHTRDLMKVGQSKSDTRHEDNPTILSDVYFRVGGAWSGETNVDCCLKINSNDVIGDNLWIWRADHGDAARSVGWVTNVTQNGLIVNGDYVTMYALMVEHFHEYQTLWNGNYGRTYFYQSETPYDVPNQAAWMSHDGEVNGYASYKVSDNVTNHEAWGLGIYTYHRDATVDLNSVMEVPEVSGVKVHNVCAVMITGNPGISHVINNSGDSANIGGARSIITEFGGEGFPEKLPSANRTWAYAAIFGGIALIALGIGIIATTLKKKTEDK